LWSLSELAVVLFPDRHGELTVSLIAAIRDVTGQQGLDAILEARSKRQIDDYRTTVAAGNSLNEQVHALANRRSAEGYMAEVTRDEVGNLLLIEHHCPICEAAKSCTGLCSAELNVFQKTLGENVEVKRAEHLLSGDQRCVYRIRNTL
jgi:predicted ArsR family transcriptional regulator